MTNTRNQQNADNKIQQNRIVRVFISSTFRDMHAEREELVKFTFPQIRKRCRERGVEFINVDLRWGVTDEQKAEGKVLPICLAEIERCQPYFIGLLGERYGWVPQEIDPTIMEEQSWLKGHKEKSVTDLEILHGVLNNEEIHGNAFFYFRHQKVSKKIETELAKQSGYLAEPDESRNKLASLKKSIQQSGYHLRENYTDTKTFGQWVLEDLWEAIDKNFPEKEALSPNDREAAEHEAFAHSRTSVYIGRNEYFKSLDKHVRGDGPPLIIQGESGSGKSALLSNWIMKYKEDHSIEYVHLHFIGASVYSSDWTTMLRRIMEEFKRRFDIQLDIPDKPDELSSAFANWLHMAAAKGRVILILDALNQLEDRDGSPDLVWLPPVIPSNIRLILSTLPGRSLKELEKRNWTTMTVQPLNHQERSLFIDKYLAQYSKELSPDHVNQISQVDHTNNPLFLQTLLEELRLFGMHEQLNERIKYYLEARTIPDLYEKILIRYEEDYGQERMGLVNDAMSYLCGSRRGLTESELLDILGTDNIRLGMNLWSPLNLAIENSLVNRSGLINFSHDYLRQAVQKKYLSTEDEQHTVHMILADYFDRLEVSLRKVDELPWQLSQAENWERLKNILIQHKFFMSAWEAAPYDVKAFWNQLEENTFSKVEAYQSVLDAPGEFDKKLVWNISTLLRDTGYPSESLILSDMLIVQYRMDENKADLQKCLYEKGVTLMDHGEFDESMTLFKEQEHLSRELGDKVGLSNTLSNQGLILYYRGELDEAMRLTKEGYRIFKDLGYKNGMLSSLNNMGNILADYGELNEAMKLYKENEYLCNELGDKSGLLIVYGNQGLIFFSLGEFDKSMNLYKEMEYICRELGDNNNLQRAFYYQALIFQDRGEFDNAMELYKEQEHICLELGNKYGLQYCLGEQASILKDRGELDDALKLYKEKESICRTLGKKDGLIASLKNQAELQLIKMNRPFKSIHLYFRVYRSGGFNIFRFIVLVPLVISISIFNRILDYLPSKIKND